MNNLHRYARARADLYKYAFMDRAKAALLGKKKDTTQPFNGIRFTSHPSGTYDLNNHLAAQAEHAAVKHAVHTAGLVPRRQATEDPREYDQNVNKLTHAFVNHIRQHVHGNPNDQLTNYYLRTADKMKVPDDPSLPKTPGQPLEYRAPLPVGVRDLSTAVMPLVRKTAEDLNLRPKSTVLLPEEPSHLPKAGDELDLDGGGDENNYIDLLDPQFEEEHPDATENRVATELHKIPDVGARRLGEFGSGKPAYEVLSDPSEQDFNFEMPQVEGLEGPTPEIQEVESHKPRAPRAKPNVIPAQKRQEMYQAIADTMKNSPIAGLSERVVKMLREAYGLSARQANSMFESYKKVGTGNKGQKPTGRRTVPEDKYGLSRRGPSPRKFGAREVEYGTETTRNAASMAHAALSGDDTPLHGLTDFLQENDHFAAPYIHRIANGEGHRGEDVGGIDYEAASRDPNSLIPPAHHIVLPEQTQAGDRQGSVQNQYLHLPNGQHVFRIGICSYRAAPGQPVTNYANRNWLLPVSPEEVQDYIHNLRANGNNEEANGFEHAFNNRPEPGPYFETRLARSGLTPQEAPPAEGPTQLSRLARVRYAKRKPVPPVPHPEDEHAEMRSVGSPFHYPGEMQALGEFSGDSEEDVRNNNLMTGRFIPSRLAPDDDIVVTDGRHKGFRGRVSSVHSNGVHISLENGYEPFVPFDHVQLDEEGPYQYAAYRAPAGGIAVRGTFYKGGSLIPDMEGSFMKPKSKLNPAKLSALKARMRMSNSKI